MSCSVYAGSKHLVSAEQLLKMKKKPILIHVGNEEDFKKGHILGASRISRAEVSATKKENPLSLELAPLARLVDVFEKAGVSNGSKIILYWGEGGSVYKTTRVFFVLDYLGLGENTAILNGGLTAWVKAGGKTAIEKSKINRGKISVSTKPVLAEMKEIADAVLNNKPLALVDGRGKKWFDGHAGSFSRGGHIPTARNLPSTSFLTKDKSLISVEEMKDVFKNAVLLSEDEIVAYCNVGNSASVVYFAARAAGLKVRLYDGSWNEWSQSKFPAS